MELKEFIEGFDNAENQEGYVRSHIIVDYVPYEIKVSTCEGIIKATSFSEDGSYKVSSPAKFMIYILNLVTSYTDIEINYENATEAFNELNKRNLTNIIPNYIPETEYNEFTTLMTMISDDYYNNYGSLQSFVDTKLSNLLSVLNDLSQDEELRSALGAVITPQ